MVFEDRWYQKECVDALYKDSQESNVYPVGAIVTGGGKTLIASMLIDKIINEEPNANILILSHVKEILKQQIETLGIYFEDLEVGVYSSGLDSRTIRKVTVAGIQSIWRKVKEFSHFDYVIIDEAHLISPNENTMYRKFLDGINAVYIGLTATPYRLGSGVIYEGEKSLFNKLSYDLTQGENFNKMIEDGYICDIFAKNAALNLDGTGVKKMAGDFSSKDLSKKYDRENITRAACMEIVYYGKNYKKWLCFAIDTEHADNIAKILNELGIKTISIHSKMNGDRDQAVEDFKNGVHRCAVNVDMLTTGLDIKTIDLIGLMRPTQSVGLYQQIVGRGLRAHPYKDHALLLDFGGNVKRHGPINNVAIKKKGDKKGNGKALTKDCPECTIINHLSAKFCCNCNFEFLAKEKITTVSSDLEIIQKGKIEKAKKVKKKKIKKVKIHGWADVSSISYRKYSKNGEDLALIVDYKCGMVKYSEYVFIGGHGYSKYKAQNWINQRWTRIDLDCPKTVKECLSLSSYLKKPNKIFVDITGKNTKILDSVF